MRDATAYLTEILPMLAVWVLLGSPGDPLTPFLEVLSRTSHHTIRGQVLISPLPPRPTPLIAVPCFPPPPLYI